jgi:GNAT superfamily N-acetyltransferase
MISQADTTDISHLTQLVNSSYRGETSRKGWTTEADLFEGNRMSEPVLLQMMDAPEAVVYKYEQEGTIKGCVYLKKEDADVYLGMLTVSPDAQANGIGKQLLLFCEETAKQWGAIRIYMRVIDVRTELINWYLRHGYENTRQRISFKGDGADVPKQPIFFTVLQKLL